MRYCMKCVEFNYKIPPFENMCKAVFSMLQTSTEFQLKIYEYINLNTQTTSFYEGIKNDSYFPLKWLQLKHHISRTSCLCSFEGSSCPAGDDLLVEISDLEADDGLEEPGPVVAPGEIRVLQHLLSHLSVELGRDVAQVALDVDQLV